jgi:predicted PurR-regulated permease PerM
MPFIIAILVSALLDPVIRRMRLAGYSRRKAVWLVWTLFVLIVIAGGVLIVPTISRQVGNLRDKIDEIAVQITASNANENFFVRWNPSVQARTPATATEIDKWFEQNRDLLQRFDLPTSRQSAISQYVEPHRKEISTAAQTFFGGLLGFVSGFGSKALLLLFTPVFVLLILLDLERLKRRAISWIPPSIRSETIDLARDIGGVFVSYLRGVTIVVFWYIVVAGVLLTLLGAPYSILLAILFALIYLIPYIGPVVNAVLLFVITGLSGKTGTFGIAVHNAWQFAASIALIYMVVMFVFDQMVYPRVVGKSVGLNPVASFFVVFSGAALFGPIGMILAFPVAGSVKIILDRLLRITSRDHEELALPSVPLRHRPSQA